MNIPNVHKLCYPCFLLVDWYNLYDPRDYLQFIQYRYNFFFILYQISLTFNWVGTIYNNNNIHMCMLNKIKSLLVTRGS